MSKLNEICKKDCPYDLAQLADSLTCARCNKLINAVDKNEAVKSKLAIDTALRFDAIFTEIFTLIDWSEVNNLQMNNINIACAQATKLKELR